MFFATRPRWDAIQRSYFHEGLCERLRAPIATPNPAFHVEAFLAFEHRIILTDALKESVF